MKALTLYSRAGCHLCELLEQELAPLLPGRATLDIVDIDRDAALRQRYGLRIPVLAAGERELSAYPLDLEGIERFLAASD